MKTHRLAILLMGAATCLTLPAAAEPTRFAPGVISQDGRIALTPAFTPDGRTAYFPLSDCAQIGPCPQRLHRSDQIDGVWSTPVRVDLGAEGRVDWPSVTPDGRYLLLSWSATREAYANLDVEEDFDLYRLDLTKPGARPEPLDMGGINRPRSGRVKRLRYVHNETSPIVTNSGDLYFWTERLEGPGERDIYLAPADGTGGFGTAEPLPAPINSAQRDNHAWVSPAGGLMIVTYNQRGGEGGADLFVSRKTDGVWSEPQPLGPAVNSPFSDIAGRLTPDGSTLIFTSTRPFDGQKAGLLQVWSVPTTDLIAAGTLTAADLTR